MRRLALCTALAIAITTLGSAAIALAEGQAKTEKFGAPLGSARPLALSAVLRSPDTYANKSVVVDGKVRAACTRKGCWMELAPGMDCAAQGCRVTFKDYGFFVPTTSAGAEARVEGVVSVRVVPPAEVSHLESEGATFSVKEKDGSGREIRIVATGVELRR